MQYRLVALSALAATAFAQTTDSSVDELASVVSVLQTALPSSLYQEALTNAPAVSSQIISEFAAGSTPGWYQSLPADIKTYLIPSGAGVVNSANSSRPVGTGAVGTGAVGNSTTLRTSSTGRGPVTVTSTRSSSQTGGSGSGSGSGSGASSSPSTASSAGGAASLPTNIVGLGFAGAVGLMGVLAL